MSVGCGHRCIRPWSLMHDPRVYNATVAHVWGVSKRQVKRGKAQADVFERKILVRKVEVEGLAADEQPAPDEELCIYFQDEVRTPESVAARRLQCCPARRAPGAHAPAVHTACKQRRDASPWTDPPGACSGRRRASFCCRATRSTSAVSSARRTPTVASHNRP